MSDVKTFARRFAPGMAMIFAVSFGLAACGGDAENDQVEAAEAAEAPAEMPAGNMAANPCDTGEAEAANPCADQTQELPEGVTAEMVAEGQQVYGGAGICSSCHGPEGAGVPNLGADLTDDEWVHSDGSYEGIVEGIMTGVTAQESSSGVPMPAKGGTNITDEQVKAVAAYVWTLNK